MGRFGLKLTLEMCSPLGQLVLEYLDKHNISLSQLAKQCGLTQQGLRVSCLKGTTPTDTTLRKLAPVLGKTPSELHYLAYGHKAGISSKNTLEQVFDKVEESIALLTSDLSATLDFEKPDENEVVEAILRLIKDLKIDSKVKVDPPKTADHVQKSNQK
jgi:transcriptional regulator with XRE-family HTH domain